MNIHFKEDFASINIDVTLKLKEELYNYAKQLAKIYCKKNDISYSEVKNLLLVCNQGLNKDNWYNIKNKDELNILNMKDLKHILKVNNLKISGKKKELIDRIWNLHNNPYTSKTKFTKKSGKNNHIISIEDSEEEFDLVDYINSSSEYIYINNGKITSKRNKRYKRKYIQEYGWVLKEYSNRYEYTGILRKNRLVKGDMPKEFKKYYLNY